MKNLILPILIIFMFSFSGITSEPVDRALSLYSVKDYRKAEEIYREMMVKPLPLWEKAIIQYNIGTLLLAEGRWKESLNQFEEISLGKDPSPLLLRYLKTNISVNLLRQGYALSLKSPFNIEKTKWLLNQSLKELNEGIEAECTYMSLEETKKQECTTPYDLIEMKKIASQLLFQIHQSQHETQIKALTLDQRIFLLIGEVQKAISHVNLLNSIDKPELKKAYQSFFSNLITSPHDLWKGLNSSSETAFDEGVASIRSGELTKSTKLLNKSLLILKEIQEQTKNSYTFKQSVEDLLFRYQLLLDQNPISMDDLESLEKDQNQILPLSPANKLMAFSHQFIDTDQSAARFFLLEASFQIERSIEKDSTSPEDILNKLILLQRHSILMNTSYQQIDNKPESAKDILIENQQEPIKQANTFIAAALAQQELMYQKEEQCQWHPWDKVFPLFDQGYSQANLAARYLSQSPPALLEALQPQDQTIKKWEEALSELKNVDNSKNTPQQPPEQIPKSVQNTLNLAQEMELQDHKPASVTSIQTQEGIRPW